MDYEAMESAMCHDAWAHFWQGFVLYHNMQSYDWETQLRMYWFAFLKGLETGAHYPQRFQPRQY